MSYLRRNKQHLTETEQRLLATLLSQLPKMSINELAVLIEKNWQKSSPYAIPYIEAMHSHNTLKDKFYAETAENIIMYFLCNAATWRGETARLVKSELRRRLA